MHMAFQIFDIDGDGFITREEITEVMGGIDIDDETWEQILDEVDENNDG